MVCIFKSALDGLTEMVVVTVMVTVMVTVAVTVIDGDGDSYSDGDSILHWNGRAHKAKKTLASSWHFI